MPVFDLEPKPPVLRYFLGLDLGKSQDYSALAIIERHGAGDDAIFHARHLQRWPLGTSYPAIVGSVTEILRRAPLASVGRGEPPVMLAVDQTGVGAPVVDMFRREKMHAEMQAIVITGGDEVNWSGGAARVPKRELVSIVQVLLQTERLKIAPALSEAATLTKELQNFQVKITDNAHDTYGAWREGTHDDLVLAVALALWTGRRPDPSPKRYSSSYSLFK